MTCARLSCEDMSRLWPMPPLDALSPRVILPLHRVATSRFLRGYFPGQMGNRLPFVDLGTDFHATQLALGRYHTCALSSRGGVKCWGGGPAVGLGFTTLSGDDVGSLPNQMGDNLPYLDLGLEVLQISAGRYFTCAAACLHHPEPSCIIGFALSMRLTPYALLSTFLLRLAGLGGSLCPLLGPKRIGPTGPRPQHGPAAGDS